MIHLNIRFFIFGFFVLTLAPLSVNALVSKQEAQSPGACEMSCQQSNFPNSCTPKGVIKIAGGDPTCAQSRLGVPTYTKMTTFGNTNGCKDSEPNVDSCASGSCTSFQGQQVLGIAHRTFPFGTRVEVCNLQNQECAIAVVVDRGPSAAIQGVTIDAYSTLSTALHMKCGTVTATYKVLSAPNVSGTAQPSGPTTVGIEALLAANGNGSGTPVAGMTYSAVNTPWGPGYLGTPPPFASGAYNSIGGTPQPTAYNGNNTVQQTPVSAQLNPTTQNPSVPSNTTAGVGIPGPTSLSILVQPKIVRPGKSIIVSWTSVNAAANSCIVLVNDLQFSSGAEGTKPFKAGMTDSGVVENFTVRCKDATGNVLETSSSASIQ